MITESINVYISCADDDEDRKLLKELQMHLGLLKQQKLIASWDSSEISAGTERANEINAHLNTAQIILLLVSPDYLASDYYYGVEMKRAVDRSDAGEARVIPILLRPVDYEGAPFSKLQVLPSNGKAVSICEDRDEVFARIAKAIRKVVGEVDEKEVGKVAQRATGSTHVTNAIRKEIRKAVGESTRPTAVHSPAFSRKEFINDVKGLLPDARIFDSEFTQKTVLSVSKDLHDAQFAALYSLVSNYRPGTRGIGKSVAIEQIGGNHWEATEAFEALVRFDFLAPSTDPHVRDHADPAYDYRLLFFGFRHLIERLEQPCDPEAGWWLASPDDLKAEQRYRAEMNRRLSELEQWLKQRRPSDIGIHPPPEESLGDVLF